MRSPILRECDGTQSPFVTPEAARFGAWEDLRNDRGRAQVDRLRPAMPPAARGQRTEPLTAIVARAWGRRSPAAGAGGEVAASIDQAP